MLVEIQSMEIENIMSQNNYCIALSHPRWMSSPHPDHRVLLFFFFFARIAFFRS